VIPSPSIIPEATDDVYIVLDDFGDLGRAWCETAETKANRAKAMPVILTTDEERDVGMPGPSRPVSVDVGFSRGAELVYIDLG
jgi:hypothetical protein